MKKLYYDWRNNRLYWDFTDDSNYIEITEYEIDATDYDVFSVPLHGGKPVFERYCQTLREACFYLEEISK